MMDENEAPVEQTVETTPETTTGPAQTAVSSGKRKMTTDPKKIVGMIFVSSFIELIAAGRACTVEHSCKGSYAFAVSVGCLSMVLCLLFWLALWCVETPNKVALQIVGIFLLLWWGFGAGFNTFLHPFTECGNGYFATWAAFYSSVYYCYCFVPAFARLVDNTKARSLGASHGEIVVLVLFISSVTELIQAITLCNDLGHCDHQYGWAVAIGAISTFFSGLLLLPKVSEVAAKGQVGFSVLTAMLWVPGAGVLTFNAPFTALGNGYFATWVSFGCAVFWAYTEVFTKNPEFKEKVKSKVQEKVKRKGGKSDSAPQV